MIHRMCARLLLLKQKMKEFFEAYGVYQLRGNRTAYINQLRRDPNTMMEYACWPQCLASCRTRTEMRLCKCVEACTMQTEPTALPALPSPNAALTTPVPPLLTMLPADMTATPPAATVDAAPAATPPVLPSDISRGITDGARGGHRPGRRRTHALL